MISFFLNFVLLCKWQSSISIFNQILKYSKYKSKKSYAPFHIFNNCDDFWQFLNFEFWPK
jgi:hypothetical protein